MEFNGGLAHVLRGDHWSKRAYRVVPLVVLRGLVKMSDLIYMSRFYFYPRRSDDVDCMVYGVWMFRRRGK